MRRILVIDSDNDTVQLLHDYLAREGYQVIDRENGAAGLLQIMKAPPDIVILEVDLDKVSGINICREIRGSRELRSLPFLFLTSEKDEASRLKALQAGANAYITKPFSPTALLSRIEALFCDVGSSGRSSNPLLIMGDLEINTETRLVLDGGVRISLSPTEYRMLEFLVSHPNQLFSREEILDAVWKNAAPPTQRIVDVYILRLRKKFERAGSDWFFKTVKRPGYMLETRSQSPAAFTIRK
jgi:two-component system, OmpR family, phosphate regulon response regulator PhoB